MRKGIGHFLEGLRLVGKAVAESPELKARERQPRASWAQVKRGAR